MAKRGGKVKDNWKKKRRQEYLEKKEFRYYIFCEGQATEPNYFQGFKRYIEDNPIYRDMVLIEIEGCQAETMRVIGKAEEYVRKNKITKGQIWCVYDKDSFPSSDVNGVVQRATVLNQKNPNIQYHAAWSNECIEFWFMLHFVLGQFTRNYTQTVKRAADNKRRYAPGWVHSTCLLRGFPKGAAPHLAHDFAEQSVVCYTLCRRCPENTVAAGEGKGI